MYQGSDPVIVVEHGKVLQFPVISLPNDKIVDTNGAGDAFVGGFLAQYVQDKPLETAVRWVIIIVPVLFNNKN